MALDARLGTPGCQAPGADGAASSSNCSRSVSAARIALAASRIRKSARPAPEQRYRLHRKRATMSMLWLLLSATAVGQDHPPSTDRADDSFRRRAWSRRAIAVATFRLSGLGRATRASASSVADSGGEPVVAKGIVAMGRRAGARARQTPAWHRRSARSGGPGRHQGIFPVTPFGGSLPPPEQATTAPRQNLER